MPSANRKKIDIVTPATTFPVSLATAKLWLRVDGTDQDTIITQLIKAADSAARKYMRRSTVNTTFKLTLDRFTEEEKRFYTPPGQVQVFDAPVTEYTGVEDYIMLPYEPLVSVTSITTYDDGNASAVFPTAKYEVNEANNAILLNEGSAWPTDLRKKAAIEVVYVAGYGTADDVPEDIIQGQLAHIAEMYDCRRPVEMPAPSKAMYNPYRVHYGMK